MIMGNFEIVSSTFNANFIFNNEALSINGSYQKDAKTDKLQTVSGAVYRQTDDGVGDHIGNFSGHNRDGEMRYSLSEMSTADTQAVMAAIAEIEQNVQNENV
jgi:hypothetical protein